jgi:NAD(P)-dependent dehydrogenase (short-subunit alcohol dehydrogenase family)
MMHSIKELVDLRGRKALITGGAGHIALAVSQTLLELGAAILLTDDERDALAERVHSLATTYSGAHVQSAGCDLTDEAAVRNMVRSAVAELNGLDILVHCAAFVGTTEMPGWAVPFENQTVAAWDAAMRVNVTSAFIMVQEAKNALTSSGKGSIIFFSSIYGVVAPDMSLYAGTSMENPAGYGTSKAGLLQMTRHFATILAPHIRVNAITPGGVWRNQPDLFRERYVQRTPLRRMATEEDVKGAVAYLASDLSSYVTGQNLIIDGGWTAW